MKQQKGHQQDECPLTYTAMLRNVGPEVTQHLDH